MVGLTMVFSPDIVMRENVEVRNVENSEVVIEYVQEDVKTPQTTIPFVKNNNFDYSWLTSWMGRGAIAGGWILFVLVVIFVVTATSNGANLTDGLDGLATGTSAIIGTALAIMAYLGANVIYSSYLNIMYIPGSEELVVYMAAFIGALVGFLLVQCISRTGIHGRHRKPHHRRHYRRIRNSHPQGTAPPDIMRDILHRGSLGNYSGSILQDYKETLWRRAKGIQNDTSPPPLPGNRVVSSPHSYRNRCRLFRSRKS